MILSISYTYQQEDDEIKEIEINNKYIKIKGAIYNSNEISTTIEFSNDGFLEIDDGENKIIYNGFSRGAKFIIDNNGVIIEADLVSISNDVFKFGSEEIYSYPGLKIKYKDGKIILTGNNEDSLKIPTINENGEKIYLNLKVGENEVIIGKNENNERIISGLSFDINGDHFSSIEGYNIGKVTIDEYGRIKKVWEGTNSIINYDNKGPITYIANSDINFYYNEDFNREDYSGENYVNYADKKLSFGGKDFRVVFSENSGYVNNAFSPKKEGSNLEFNLYGADIEIENKEGASKSESFASKITIIGDKANDKWVDIKNGYYELEVTKDGVKSSFIGIENEPIPLDLRFSDTNGESLLKDDNLKEDIKFKMSINSDGNIIISTDNALTDTEGNAYCNEAGSSGISSNVIAEHSITGRGLSLQPKSISGDCYSNWVYLTGDYSISSSIENSFNNPIVNFDSNINNNQINRNNENIDSVDINPEYAGNLDNIALFLKDKNVLLTQLEIIKNLPDNTHVKLVIPDSWSENQIKKWLPSDVLDRVTIIKTSKDYLIWAQDFSEGNSKVQLLPLTYLGGGTRKRPENPGNEIISEFEKYGIQVRKVPIEFGGGNVFIANDKDGNKKVLIGSNSYLETVKTYGWSNKKITEDQFKEIIRREFNVNDVILIGKRDSQGIFERQPENAFHIDQIMLPTDDGVVLVPKVDFGSYKPGDYEYRSAMEIKEQLESYKKVLKENGFQTKETFTYTPDSISKYFSYSNGIVYTDKKTHQKTIMMPIFPDRNGIYKMEGLNLQNKNALEKEGYKVIPIKDRAFRNQGNIHCITLLAQSPQNPPNCQLIS